MRGKGSPIVRFFGILPEESQPLLLLALRAAFVSLYAVVGKAYQSALFLDRFDASSLPWQYGALAGLAIFFAVFYSLSLRSLGKRKTDRTLFSVLSLGLIIPVFLQNLFLSSSFVFGFCIWILLLDFLYYITLWESVLMAFASRRARILLPIVASAATLGCVLGGLLTRIVAADLGNQTLLPILAVLSVIITCLITRNSQKQEETPKKEQVSGNILKDGLRVLFHNRLAGFLTLVILLSLPLQLGTDLIFKKVLQMNYGIDAMSAVLGSYFLYLNIGVLILQVFVMGSLMRRWGIAIMSGMTPALLCLALLALVFFPTLTAAMAMAVTFGICRTTFFNNSRNQLFTPLSAREKDTSAAINRLLILPAGTIMASGLLLAVKNSSVQVLAGLFAGLSILVLLAAWKASGAYQTELVSSLKKRTLSVNIVETELSAPDAAAFRQIREMGESNDLEEAAFAITILAQWGDLESGHVRRLLSGPESMKRLALDLAAELKPDERGEIMRQIFETEESPRILGSALESIGSDPGDWIVDLSRRLAAPANPPHKRMVGLALSALQGSPTDQTALRTCLDELAADEESGSLALKAAGVIGKDVSHEFLLSSLKKVPLRRQAARAVVSAGLADQALEIYLDRSSSPGVLPYLISALAERAEPSVQPIMEAILQTNRLWLTSLVLTALERKENWRVLSELAAGELPKRLASALIAVALAERMTESEPCRMELEAEMRFLIQGIFVCLRIDKREWHDRLTEIEGSLAGEDSRQRNAALELLEKYCQGGWEWFLRVFDKDVKTLKGIAHQMGVSVSSDGDVLRLVEQTSDAVLFGMVSGLIESDTTEVKGESHDGTA